MERKAIKQVLSRKKNHRVSDYVRYLRKLTGRTIKRWEVTSRLLRMQREGQLRFSIVNNHVIGFLLPIC